MTILTIGEVENYLQTAPNSVFNRDSSLHGASLKHLKKLHVEEGYEVSAKRIWCLEEVLLAQDKYVAAFIKMKEGEFYKGWCDLEQVELALLRLDRHFNEPNYHLDFIGEHTERFQSLFPYKIFTSPGYIKKEIRCSICDSIVSIRKTCGHVKGDIYSGEMCCHIIKEVDLDHTAFVFSPVQKYSVPFLVDSTTNESYDQYDYSILQYLMRGLQSPFHDWHYEETETRHPHKLFQHVGRNGKCPCKSGKKYKHCCLKETGVLRPHTQFYLSEPPPKDLPSTLYLGYQRN